jgi:hypothetical protein
MPQESSSAKNSSAIEYLAPGGHRNLAKRRGRTMASSLVRISSARGQLALQYEPHPMPPMIRFGSPADEGPSVSRAIIRSGAFRGHSGKPAQASGLYFVKRTLASMRRTAASLLMRFPLRDDDEPHPTQGHLGQRKPHN